MSDETAVADSLNRWLIRGRYFVGAASLFGALLYFVGRRYLEAYYLTTGIPPELLQFSIADYVYSGAHPFRLLVVILFTAIGIGLIRLASQKEFDKPVSRVTGERRKAKTVREKGRQFLEALNKKLETGFFYYMLGLFILYCFILPILAGIEAFGGRPDFRGMLVLSYLSIVLILFTVVGAVITLFDRRALLRLSRHSKTRALVLWSGALLFFFLPYLGAGAYGSFMGFQDISKHRISRVFDTVTLIANQPLNIMLDWERVTNDVYKTADKLYLLGVNSESLFIRLDNDHGETLIIPKARLSSFVINSPSSMESSP